MNYQVSTYIKEIALLSDMKAAQKKQNLHSTRCSQ